MKVICINDENDSRLNKGSVYTLSKKRKYEHSFSIIGKPGLYSINKFRFIDGSEIIKNKRYSNFRYINNLNSHRYLDIAEANLEYVLLRPDSKLKALKKDSFYKIEHMYVLYDKLYIRLDLPFSIKNIRYKYNSKNFKFYTKEEYEIKIRYDKIKKLRKNEGNLYK